MAIKPADNAKLRDAYRSGCTRLLDGLARCKTDQDIKDFLQEWRDSTRGRRLGPERVRPDESQAKFDWALARRQTMTPAFAFRSWMEAGNVGSLEDYLLVWQRADNFPALRAQLLDMAGLAGWRENADGSHSPLYKDEAPKSEQEYQTMALGNRFAQLVSMEVGRKHWGPVLRWRQTWSGVEVTSRERKAFDAEMAKISTWDWVKAEEKKVSDKPKPEMGEISIEDSRWTWTRSTGTVERKGPPVASPKDSVEFLKAFGLPGVEYGNWANDADREWHVTHAFAAMRDLADVLGCTPEEIGINGRLSVAFGARGTGGKRAPCAHYEPARRVINITKLRGAGTLAHEWGHFLDHALLLAHKPGGGFLSEQGIFAPRGMPEDVADAMREIMRTIKIVPTDPEVRRKNLARRSEINREIEELNNDVKHLRKIQRDELRAHGEQTDETTKALADANKKDMALRREWHSLKVRDDETDHYAAAKKLAGGNYYCKDVELFARAFESWVSDRLEGMGRKNGYLVSGINDPTPGVYMPKGEHRDKTNAAIDRLISAIHKHEHLRKSIA